MRQGDCPVFLGYSSQPGWFTVSEAEKAIQAGYEKRLMLEMSPDRAFGILSPAFRGCEGDFARQFHASLGCTFLRGKRCNLHSTDFQPLECRCYYQEQDGPDPQCHADIAQDWDSPAGRALVVSWTKRVGLWPRLQRYHWI